ncbi:40720_t:CDS:2, partial [Gigaspora margarita]
DDKFESLEAFEDAAKSAAKVNGFAFARKDSNLTGRQEKSQFVILQYTKGGQWLLIRAVATKCHSTENILNIEIKWIVTKVILDHDHPM